MGDLGLNPRLGRSPGERKGYPFQYFGLENSMDCKVHGVTGEAEVPILSPPDVKSQLIGKDPDTLKD